MATLEQLHTALVNADRAGDTAAARRLAQEIQRYRNAGVTDIDPNEGMGLGQKLLVGVGRSMDKTARGVGELALRGADMIPGVDLTDRANAMQAQSQANDRLWNQNATGAMRGAELVTDIGQFAVPASGVAKGVQGAGMLSRVGAQGAAAIGTDAIQQQGEGQEGIDVGRSAATGLFAGGGELAAPFIGRAYQAVKSRIKTGDPVKVGRAMAAELGMGEVADDVARNLARSAEEFEAGARPGSVIAEQEFGFKPTRAQKTGDFADASREDILRQKGNRRIQAADQFNENRLDEVVTRLTGGLDSPQTAVDDVQSAVRGRFEQAREAQKDAWEFARSSELIADGRLADDFADRVTESLRSDGRIVNENIASEARAVIDGVDEVLRRSVDETGGINFKQIEEARKVLTKSQGSVRDPASRAAIGIAKREFDQSLDDLTEATILSGDIEDIQKLKNAIGVSREVFSKFSASGSQDKVGKMVENILKNGNLDDLSAAVLGSAQVAPRAGANFARAVKRTLGEDAPELQQVRQAVLLKAATRKTGERSGMAQISQNMKTLMNQRRDLLNELFSKREISQLGRLTMALDDMSRQPGNIGRDSGTTGRAIRYLNEVAGDGVLGVIPRILGGVNDFFAAGTATAPLRTTPTVPALPAAAAASNPNRPTRP